MIAWSLLPTRFEDGRHEAIEQGLRANGYDVRHGGSAAIRSDDVLVTWNSHGRTEALSAQFKAAGARHIVCEEAYFRRVNGEKHIALALWGHNGSGTWKPGGPGRFARFGIDPAPWRRDGDHVLVCGQRGFGYNAMAMPNAWPDDVHDRLRQATKRPIWFRPHPKRRRKMPTAAYDRVLNHEEPLVDHLRGAWAVVVWSSNAATVALRHGVRPSTKHRISWPRARPRRGWPGWSDRSGAIRRGGGPSRISPGRNGRSPRSARAKRRGTCCVKIKILCASPNRRARHVGEAMAAGLRRHGSRPGLTRRWSGAVTGDLLIAYGWSNQPAFEAYRRAGGNFVCIDLGFWHRKPAGRQLEGHHKVSVNGRHPVDMIGRGFPSSRFEALRIAVAPWTCEGEHILVARTSARAAIELGLDPQAWEREVIERLRPYTDRPIIYRPKPTPTWRDPPPIEGAGFSAPDEKLGVVLKRSWAVVTRHSNVAIDGLVMGVPCYAEAGVAREVSMKSPMDIERPRRDVDRNAFFADLAWCQWTPAEMRSGACWDFLKAHIP